MEKTDDSPEDVKRATPVEREIKRGQKDDTFEGYPRIVEKKKRWEHCDKTPSKKSKPKDDSNGDCSQKREGKKKKSSKFAMVTVVGEPCTFPKVDVMPRHCLTKEAYIDMLATPRRQCPPDVDRKMVLRRLKPVSPRIKELAQPQRHRMLITLQEGASILPPALLDNLVRTVEKETCLTPEQAATISRKKKLFGKKKRGRKDKRQYKEGTKYKKSSVGVASSGSFDKDSVCCQYIMAERFVRSILKWKCSIPKSEFNDVAEVIVRRLVDLLEYSYPQNEDRKSQQLRYLADVIASWITGVLSEVARYQEEKLLERCRKKEEELKEEEEEEESDEEDEEDRDKDAARKKYEDEDEDEDEEPERDLYWEEKEKEEAKMVDEETEIEEMEVEKEAEETEDEEAKEEIEEDEDKTEVELAVEVETETQVESEEQVETEVQTQLESEMEEAKAAAEAEAKAAAEAEAKAAEEAEAKAAAEAEAAAAAEAEAEAASIIAESEGDGGERVEEEEGKVEELREGMAEEGTAVIEEGVGEDERVAMEESVDKVEERDEIEEKMPSELEAPFAKEISRDMDVIRGLEELLKSELPFLTFDKIIDTIYKMIESTPENTGEDPITNGIHRAIYEKLSNIVKLEDPDLLTEELKNIMNVVCGKIANWLRSILTKSQIAFMQQYVPEVESKEIRDWTRWLAYISDVANDWNVWLRSVIEKIFEMEGEQVTRGEWHDWTKAVDTKALLWRRFHLQTLHQAQRNATMMIGRRVVKTGTKGAISEQSEHLINATDLQA